MIDEAPEKFSCGVTRALLANQLECPERELAGQFFAQRFGQIGHGIPIRHATRVEPSQELRNAILRFAPCLEPRFELFFCLRFDVARHGRSLIQAIGKPKRWEA